MISGFIISLSTRRKESPLEFSIKRSLRIYPPYIFSFAILLFLLNENYRLMDVVKSLILIPLNSHAAGPYYGYSILLVAWTLSYELFFYFCFLVSMSLSQKYRAVICSLILSSLIIFGNYYLFGSIGVNPHTRAFDGGGIFASIIFITNPIIINFILGMLAEFIYSNTKTNNKLLNKAIKMLAPIVAVISVWGMLSPSMWMGEMQWAIPCFGLVTSLSLLEKSGVSFEFPSLVKIGAMSFSIYLIHPIIIELLSQKYFVVFWQDGFTKFSVIILITVFAARIMYETIEIPSQKLARKLISKIR